MSLNDNIEVNSDAESTDTPEATSEQIVVENLLKDLEAAASAEQRVTLFATYTDTFGLDALISFLPIAGDGASSVISATYLLFEAERLDMSFWGKFKIMMHQLIDFGIGSLVPPGIDGVADYAYQANKFSANEFEALTDSLVEKARETGVSENRIQAIVSSKRTLNRHVRSASEVFKPTR